MNYQNYILFLLLCFYSGTNHAQFLMNNDSLKQILHTANNLDRKIITLNFLSQSLLQTNPEEAKQYILQAIRLEKQEKGFEYGEATSFASLGNYYQMKGDLDSAIICAKISLDLRHISVDEEPRNEGSLGFSMTDLGNYYSEKGDFDEANTYFLKGLDLLEKGYRRTDKFRIPDASIVNSYASAGDNFIRAGMYDRALEYLFKSSAIADSLGLSDVLGNNYNSIGAAYNYMNKCDAAIFFNEKALAYMKQTKNALGEGICLLNMAEYLYKQQKYKEAIEQNMIAKNILTQLDYPSALSDVYDMFGNIYMAENKHVESALNYEKAFEIRKKMGVSIPLGTSYLNLSKVSLQNHDLPKAKEYALLALAIFTEKKALREKKDTYEQLANISTTLHNYEEADKYRTAYIATNDSLLKKDGYMWEREFQLAQNRNKEEDLKNAAKENKRKNQINILLACTTLIFLSLLFFIFYLWKKVQKQNASLQIKNREIYHNLKNNLFFLSVMMEEQSKLFNNQAMSEAMQDMKGRINAIALVSELLYEKDNVFLVKLPEYVGQLTTAIQQLLAGRLAKSVQVSLDIAEIQIAPELTKYVGLIINELFINAHKHAFADVDTPQFEVLIDTDPKQNLCSQILLQRVLFLFVF